MEQGRAAERILPRAPHLAERLDEVSGILMQSQQFEIALDGLLDMVFEHRDDQLILAGEVRIERAAGEAGRGRDRLDAGAADALFLEHAGGRLEQFVAGIVPGRPGP